MGKVFGTVSGKGGVGKSTVSVGLGISFAKTGKKVLLVDMDEGLRCLDLLLGVDNIAVFDLADILKGKEIESAVYKSTLEDSLFLIPAPAKIGEIDKDSFKDFALAVSEMFDIVIFDFPAGIDMHLYKCLPDESLFLTVAVPDPVSVRDAAAVSDALYENSLQSRLIINRFKYNLKKKLRFKNIDDIIDAAALRLVGIVPESDEISVFSVTGKLPEKCKVSKAFARIADRLSGNVKMLPRLKKI